VGMKTLPVWWEMQQTGMPASRKFFEDLESEILQKMDSIQSELSTVYYSGLPINPLSRLDVQNLMRRRGLEGTKRSKKTQTLSTSEESIGYLQYIDPAIKLVFDWRALEHDKSHYCSKVLESIPEGHYDPYPMRYRYNPHGTTSRRLSSNRINILAMKPSIRHGYICPGGRVFGSWDYSQIEMRYAAHLSEDPLLCAIFREGRDVHSETAAATNDIQLDESLPLDIRYSCIPTLVRRAAKTINFGILYGQRGQGLLTQLYMQGLTDWTLEKADQKIRSTFRAYRGLKYRIDLSAEMLRGNGGKVVDHWGMIRYLGGIYADASDKEGREIVAESERQAFSHEVQGGARGMILNAIAYLGPVIQGLQESGLDIWWHLDYHDELIFSFPPDLFPLMDEIVKDAMVNHCGIELRVPVLVEGHMGRTWGELK